MIISFKNLNGGGGGYVLPTATPTRLGGVKIGDGINVDSAGTISVQGGGGIEVVTELPASGTDGQIVVLKNEETAYISISGTGVMDTATTVVYSGITERTPLFDYSYYGEYVNVYLESDETFTFYSHKYQEDSTISDGDTFDVEGIGAETNVITVTKVADGEWLFENSLPIERLNINNVSPNTSYKTYMWSDDDIPSVDIDLGGCVQWSDDYFYSEVEFHFDEIPSFEGSAFTICLIGEAGFGQDHYRYIQYTSGGTFEWVGFGQTIALNADGNMHYAYDGRLDKYLISDGYIKIIGLPSDSSLSFITIDNSNPLGYDELWNGEINKNGWVEFGRRGIQQKGQHNYRDFMFTANLQQIPYNTYGINIWQPPYPVGGNKVLFTPSLEYMEWRDLVIPKTEIYQSLPYGGNEGDLALTNSEYSPTTASTFISRNSTNESDRNNFSDNDDIGWYDGGNSYIYFGNASAYTNTKDTFLYKIALVTNENGDWGTSNIAYINVVKNGNTYEIFMDNFNYYDTGGTPTPYTFTMYLSQTGNTSGNTPYLPIWRWWDGGYGYKFHFELDQDNNLKMWMRHSDVDRDQQDPDYVEGQNYGYIGYRCMNHTTVFYDYINFDQDDTHFSIYKGGVWYELGYLTRQGV